MSSKLLSSRISSNSNNKDILDNNEDLEEGSPRGDRKYKTISESSSYDNNVNNDESESLPPKRVSRRRTESAKTDLPDTNITSAVYANNQSGLNSNINSKVSNNKANVSTYNKNISHQKTQAISLILNEFTILHRVLDSLENELQRFSNDNINAPILIARIDKIHSSLISKRYRCIKCTANISIDRVFCRSCSK